jgi:hypothetical protein
MRLMRCHGVRGLIAGPGACRPPTAATFFQVAPSYSIRWIGYYRHRDQPAYMKFARCIGLASLLVRHRGYTNRSREGAQTKGKI